MQEQDIHIGGAPSFEVRFTSLKTIYLESLVEGRWVSRYRSASGRINFPYEGWNEDAFQVGIGGEAAGPGWEWVSAEEAPGTDRGARHLVVTLSNPANRLGVKVHTLVDGTPVLTRWLEIANTSNEPAALTAVYPWCGKLCGISDSTLLPPAGLDHAFTLGYFTEWRQYREGWFEWRPLPAGDTEIVGDKGQGHDDPFFILRDECRGEHFICHMAWSANWRIEFTCEQDPARTGVVFRIGPTAKDALRVIAPGETIKTPEVHLGHIEGDLDAAVQAMHDHLRRTVLPRLEPSRAYRVQYAACGDQGYLAKRIGDTAGGDEKGMLDHIGVAAAIGAEVFIVDAGWWDVPGDWLPSPERYPRGLAPVRDYAHQKGMLFGLYNEFERVNTWNSGIRKSTAKVAVEHPEWIGPHSVLTLSNPEAAAYAESEVNRIITDYGLDLYRIDYNPIYTYEGASTDRDGVQENNYWRYYEAFYGIVERTRARYPDLILQQAAAGGARNDLGTAGRFHETYLTDGLSVPNVLQVYSGQTLALPPEVLVIGLAEGAHSPNGSGPLDTHLRCTFTLSTPWVLGGVAPSVEELSPDRKERYRRYTAIYKTFIRPLLATCKVYHHAPVSDRGGVNSGGWFAMEYAAPDRTKGWATIVRTGTSGSDVFTLRSRGLDPTKTYTVTLDSLDTTVDVEGLRLIQEGLPVRLASVLSSELLLFTARETTPGPSQR